MSPIAAADPGKLPSHDTHTAASGKLEGAGAASRLSVSPANSMLPWDKPGIWPAVGDSMHSRDPQASMHSTTATSDVPGAAPSVPVTLMGQPSRLSVTVAGTSQQPSIPEGLGHPPRPSSLPTVHDRGQPMYISQIPSAHHRQHDSIDFRGGLPGSTNSLWAGRRSQRLPEDGQHGTTAPADLLSRVHVSRAHASSGSPGQHHQEHARPSKGAWEAASQRHMTGPLKDSHMTVPAASDAALPMLEQGPGHTGPMESAGQAMAWGRPSSRSLCGGGSAEAEMQSAHHWLGMHGYSDAAVHVTANVAERGPPHGTVEPEGKHVMGPSSMATLQAVSEKLADGLPGAIQHGYSRASRERPLVDAPSTLQRDTSHVWQGTASSGTEYAVISTGSAASFAQNPINVRGVALNRTMPSIWDLDI